MDNKKLFEKYYLRLRTEAILKSLVCGAIVGFGVDFIVAFVTWFFIDVFNLWFLIALGVGAIVGLLVGIILYFKAFKPTPEKIAARVDELGLEERVITMYRYSNSDSYVAQKQREDAKARMSNIGSKSLKIIVARSLIIAAVVVGVVGLGMTTANALSGLGIIDNPNLLPPAPDSNTIRVEYEVSDILGGYIDGEPIQIIERGRNTTPVVAVANDGYIFLYWEEDHNSEAERYESDVQYDLVFTAVFEEVGFTASDAGDDEGEPDPDDPPPEEGDNSDDKGEIDSPIPIEPDDKNYYYYKDGKTPFWEQWDVVYPEVMEDIASNPNLSEGEKEYLQNLYESLNAGIRNETEDE